MPTEQDIRQALSDCKSVDRHIVANGGRRYWVFGISSDSVLAERVENGIRKPLCRIDFSAVESIEENVIEENVIEENVIEETNQELMAAMAASGKLAIVHVGTQCQTVKNDGLERVYAEIRKKRMEKKSLPQRCEFCGLSTLVENWKGSGEKNMHCFDCKQLHVVKEKPVLQSKRFAKVIGNELHVRKYEDPSHGWLAVPMQWLEALRIVGKISSYSYRRNSTAYLEEDDDMHEFAVAAKRAGFQIFRDCHHTDKSSPVRSYPTYHTTGFTVEPNFSEALSNSTN
jgi:hypothetical protein